MREPILGACAVQHNLAECASHAKKPSDVNGILCHIEPFVTVGLCMSVCVCAAEALDLFTTSHIFSALALLVVFFPHQALRGLIVNYQSCKKKGRSWGRAASRRCSCALVYGRPCFGHLERQEQLAAFPGLAFFGLESAICPMVHFHIDLSTFKQRP